MKAVVRDRYGAVDVLRLAEIDMPVAGANEVLVRVRAAGVINRLSTKELHRRHLPITTQFIPLLERGQAMGVFRSDVSAVWLIAVVRAIVHTASTELQAGRLTQAEVERTMLTTALAAVSST